MRKKFSYGVIPLRLLENQWQVLIVQHRAGHWAFPKGHTEVNETPKQTAERELVEETGLKVKRYLNQEMFQENYCFKHQNILIKKQVGYFLALVEGEVKIQEEEIQAFQWLFLEESLDVLTFKENKKIIQSVQKLLDLSPHPL